MKKMNMNEYNKKKRNLYLSSLDYDTKRYRRFTQYEKKRNEQQFARIRLAYIP